MATMIDLFRSAGFSEKEVVSFPLKVPVQPKIPIEVLSYNTQKNITEWKKVISLFYKGNSDEFDTYQIFVDKQTFLVTGEHLLFDYNTKEYIPTNKVSEFFIGSNSSGNPISVRIVPIRESFPILDIEVEDNNNYFSGGILSHNSFGRTAALFSQGLRKLNPYLSRYNTSLLLINQVRDKIGGYSAPGMPPPESSPGGRAIKFYASWRGRVSRIEDILDKKEVIGNSIKVKNLKSKIGFPKRSAELDLLYGTGFSPDAEYISFIISLGLVKVAGSWISNDDWGFKGQGRDSLLAFLHEHPTIFEECKKIVNASFTTHSILDESEEDVDEDDDIQETSVFEEQV